LKKATALFLVVLFSFNLFGYVLVVEFLQNKASKELEVALDHNRYDASQLIEVKVPVSMPYQTDWSLYQRFDGEIEIGGMPYKFVKRKLSGDTLYIVCIPNSKKLHLQKARNNYFALSSDLSNTNTKNSGSSKAAFKNLQTEYDVYAFCQLTSLIAEKSAAVWHQKEFMRLPSTYPTSPEHPPEIRS
jgi:hypothetical protein